MLYTSLLKSVGFGLSYTGLESVALLMREKEEEIGDREGERG